jgi:hypothetical protein
MTSPKDANLEFDWQYYVIQQNEDEEEPMGDKFFDNSESLTSVSSLIRESVQNSIDAYRDPSVPVRMRFFVGAMNENLSTTYLGGLMPHIDTALRNPLSGLNIANQKYLVVEDFNTNGLRGSTFSGHPKDDPTDPYKDSFYYFVWKAGESNKLKNSGGKWGVGKVVFSFVSQIKTYLVYSSRDKKSSPEGNHDIMFGHSVLKTHDLQNQKRCKAKHRLMTTDANNNHVPFSDRAVLDKFSDDWNLSRKFEELGTSVVIPFCFEEFDITTLTQALIQDYFMAILEGDLECEIADAFGNDPMVLNSSTLMSNIEELPSSLKTDASKSKEELLNLCRLFQSRLSDQTKTFKVRSNQSKPNNWDDIDFPAEMKEALALELMRNGPVILELEVAIPSASKPKTLETGSCFVYLQRIQGFRTRTTFCRQGILVPDVSDKLPIPTDYLSLVHIPKGNLADFLGAAEDPSHKTWSAKQQKFREQYTPFNLSRDGISFVRYATNRILQFSQNSDSNQDKTSLAKYFPMANSGVPTPTTSSPKFLLFAKTEESDPSTVKFKWSTSHFEPSLITLIQTYPDSQSIDVDATKNSLSLKLKNPDLAHEFFLRGKDDQRTIDSNRVTIKPKTPPLARVEILQKDNGFCVSNSVKNQLRAGAVIEIRVAYDQRDGNPLRSWGSEDFVLGQMLNKRKTRGLDIKCLDNSATLIVKTESFNAEFNGFDDLRDLLIDARLITE